MALTDEQEKEIKSQLDAAKASADKLQKEIEELKKNSKPAGKEDDPEDENEDDLRTKLAKEKEAAAKSKAESKKVEDALSFNLTAKTFVEENKEILPSEMAELIRAAEKESYDSAVEKANVIKSNLIQSFFSIQANQDLLTASQKSQLDDYLKLTKNGKVEKAAEVYENIMEPAIQTLKKVKTAEEVGRANAGFAKSTKTEDAYKERLIKGSEQAYLGFSKEGKK